MALRRVGVGAEKNQLCAVVADDYRVAGQVDVDQPGELDDVLAKNIGLGFRCREEYLVVPGLERAQQRLTGELERRANLVRFENVANAVHQPARYHCNETLPGSFGRRQG